MKKILEKIRTFFSALGAKLKRKPKAVLAVNEPITAPRGQGKQTAQAAQGAKPKKVDRFAVISWAVTLLLVAVLLGGAVFYKNSHPTTHAPAVQPTGAPTSESSAGTQVSAPAISAGGSGVSSIARKLQLKTNIPERERYQSIFYRVSRGDAMLSSAEQFKLKSET